MLGQIIVDDQNVTPFIHKIFGHSRACIGCNILNRCAFCCRRIDHNGIIHSPILSKGLYQMRYTADFLANGHIDTEYIFSFLVQDGVHSDRGFTGLTIADDQLSLTLTNWEHRINGQDSRIHGFIDRLPVNDPGSILFNCSIVVGMNRAFPIHWFSKGIDHSPDKVFSYRNTCGFFRSMNPASFCHISIVTKQNNSDFIPSKILYHTSYT